MLVTVYAYYSTLWNAQQGATPSHYTGLHYTQSATPQSTREEQQSRRIFINQAAKNVVRVASLHTKREYTISEQQCYHTTLC
jgi:hypothetical protein